MSNRTYVCLDCRTSKRAKAAYGLVTDYRCRSCSKPLSELGWERRMPTKTDDQGWHELRVLILKHELEWTPRRTLIGLEKIKQCDTEISTQKSRAYDPQRKKHVIKKLQAERLAKAKAYNLSSA